MDKVLLLLSAISFCILLAIMFFTLPSEVGPLGILVFFILAYVLFVGLAVSGCRLFFTFRAKLDKTKRSQIRRKSYYYGIVVALAPVFLLLCRSFGGLTLVDLGLVLALEVVLCFMVSRNVL